MPGHHRFVLGVTGASGAIYGARLLTHLRRLGCETRLIVSGPGEKVAASEGFLLPADIAPGTDGLPGTVIRHDNSDLWAAPASGSFRHDGMVIAPCSAGTAGRLAAGTNETLLLRAADVCLKEGRPLVLLVREAPLSLLHLRNLERLCEAGARIIPASPGFYTRPRSIDELVDGLLQRVLDQLGLEADIAPRWQDQKVIHA